jgi:peptidoglycan/xylan/chitin deacetylase (PgdA/CDA1 family)
VSGGIEVALTLDVEGDFGSTSLRGLDEALPRLLDALDARAIPATLFVVGDAARARPAAIREAIARGHAVASHSMTHPSLSRCSRARQRAELADSRAALEGVTGAACVGFRAPYFDLPRDLGPLLEETGYAWSSSKAPFSPVALYRHLGQTGAPHTLSASRVREFPVPGLLGLPIPEGLSYRRIFRPLLALRPRPPRVFYLHPYELLDRVEDFALPRWMRPFVTLGQGRAAGDLLWRTVDAWRAAGARFVTLPGGSA